LREDGLASAAACHGEASTAQAHADNGGAAGVHCPHGEGGGGAQTEGHEESERITRAAASHHSAECVRCSSRGGGAQTEGGKGRQRMTREAAIVAFAKS